MCGDTYQNQVEPHTSPGYRPPKMADEKSAPPTTEPTPSTSGAGTSDEPCLDAHGFEVPEQLLSKYNATRQSAEGGPAASVSWPALLEQAALKGYQSGGPLPPRFVAAVREGVPDAHRAEAWLLLSGAARKRDGQPGLYAAMLAAGRARGDLEVEEQIDRDLHRTFPGHPALTEPFCQRIKNVLLAYSARNPEVAYCQVRPTGGLLPHALAHALAHAHIPCHIA